MNTLRDKLCDLCQSKDPDLDKISDLLVEEQEQHQDVIMKVCLNNLSVLGNALTCGSARDSLLSFRLQLSTAVVQELMSPEHGGQGPTNHVARQSLLDLFLQHLDSDQWNDGHLCKLVEMCISRLEDGPVAGDCRYDAVMIQLVDVERSGAKHEKIELPKPSYQKFEL